MLKNTKLAFGSVESHTDGTGQNYHHYSLNGSHIMDMSANDRIRLEILAFDDGHLNANQIQLLGNDPFGSTYLSVIDLKGGQGAQGTQGIQGTQGALGSASSMLRLRLEDTLTLTANSYIDIPYSITPVFQTGTIWDLTAGTGTAYRCSWYIKPARQAMNEPTSTAVVGYCWLVAA